ncbi:intraflagellar transport protein 46 homolog [Myxocyprinus asiaticus]|uniref:intraflagellar transport protein 46 homolog n=1 Tax=Myxocyprinus asiaticus TaxID=70543 RepID=UPI0022224FD0|nr:intraflagellar transport protein 46 homolog [Myxocyprinus asiaticus]
MPDIDNLMQEWLPEIEELLRKVNLPTADIDCDYVDIICGILDIPVYKNQIHTLHILFILYSEFKNSQHFKSVAEGQKSEAPSASRIATADFRGVAIISEVRGTERLPQDEHKYIRYIFKALNRLKSFIELIT